MSFDTVGMSIENARTDGGQAGENGGGKEAPLSKIHDQIKQLHDKNFRTPTIKRSDGAFSCCFALILASTRTKYLVVNLQWPRIQ